MGAAAWCGAATPHTRISGHACIRTKQLFHKPPFHTHTQQDSSVVGAVAAPRRVGFFLSFLLTLAAAALRHREHQLPAPSRGERATPLLAGAEHKVHCTCVCMCVCRASVCAVRESSMALQHPKQLSARGAEKTMRKILSMWLGGMCVLSSCPAGCASRPARAAFSAACLHPCAVHSGILGAFALGCARAARRAACSHPCVCGPPPTHIRPEGTQGLAHCAAPPRALTH